VKALEEFKARQLVASQKPVAPKEVIEKSTETQMSSSEIKSMEYRLVKLEGALHELNESLNQKVCVLHF
jgi:hypothetical protein